MSIPLLSEVEEDAFFVPVSNDDAILVCHTKPPASPNGVGVLLLAGGAVRNVSFERNRVGAIQARRLAGMGFHVARFDYKGIGDSTGEVDKFFIEEPPSGDAEAVVSWMMSELPVERVVVIAACMGARTALALASKCAHVEGMVLASMPPAINTLERRAAEWKITKYIQTGVRPGKVGALFDRRRRRQFFSLMWRRVKTLFTRFHSRRRKIAAWVSASTLDNIEACAKRGVPMLFVYGTEDPHRRDFHEAQAGRLGGILKKAGPLVEITEDLPGVVHGFSSLKIQAEFIDTCEEWVARKFLR